MIDAYCGSEPNLNGDVIRALRPGWVALIREGTGSQAPLIEESAGTVEAPVPYLPIDTMPFAHLGLLGQSDRISEL